MVLQSLVHPTRTLDELNKQRKTGLFTDITILVHDKKFPAHRALLAAHSPVFKSVLEDSALSLDNAPNINLDGVETSYFDVLLDFIYTSKLNVNLQTVDLVKATAAFLQVSAVVDLCDKYKEAKNNLENCSIMTVNSKTKNKQVLADKKPFEKAAVKPIELKMLKEVASSCYTHNEEKIEIQLTECEQPAPSNLENSGEFDLTESSQEDEELERKPLEQYQCHICNKQLTEQRLEAHMTTHYGEKPAECRYCHRSFANIYNLRIHERSHTGERPYQCKLCDKTFADPSTLCKHNLWHSGIKTKKCAVCGRCFMTRAQVREHMKTHTKEKPFQCPHCEKSFAYKCDYKSHLRDHTGNLFGPCEYCGRCFNHRGNFNVHVKNHKKKLGQQTSSYTPPRGIRHADEPIIKMNDLAQLVSQGHSIAVMADGKILVKPTSQTQDGVEQQQPLVMSPEDEIVSATVSIQESMTGENALLQSRGGDCNSLIIVDQTEEVKL